VGIPVPKKNANHCHGKMFEAAKIAGHIKIYLKILIKTLTYLTGIPI
jgi:hypothetical protein